MIRQPKRGLDRFLPSFRDARCGKPVYNSLSGLRLDLGKSGHGFLAAGLETVTSGNR
jgi:hypothetical protein